MKKTNEVIAENVRRLMESQRLKQTDLAKKTDVSQRTISNILNPSDERSTTTESLEKIATYFGLQAFHLMIENLPIDKQTARTIDRMISCYISTTDEGKEAFKRVTELESRYVVNVK